MAVNKYRLKSKITLINMMSSLILQAVTMISGLIVPKLILSTFGSEVNGLVSSLNQFLSYITLLEGGITGIVMTNLYKPIVEKKYDKIEVILSTAKKFYRKIGIIYIVYAIILAILYPILFDLNFSYLYVFSLTIILSFSMFIQYMFSITLRTLLNADKKIYIVSFIQIIISLSNLLSVIIITKYFKNIHILKIMSGLLYLIQPLFFSIYIKRHYNLNLKSKKTDGNIIKQRWNGFTINTAYFIHYSTDITILTIFTNLSIVSVYNVYSIVVSCIKQIINSVITAINPVLGQSYAKGDKNEIENKLSMYEYIVLILIFVLFSITGLLIRNFVLLYTFGINDADYNQGIFAILLIFAEALYLLKMPHLNLSYAANKYKEITKPALIEALINIVISIILVRHYGLIGVAIGTCIAMLYRLIFHINFTKKLMGRKQWIFYKKLLLFLVTNSFAIFVCLFVAPSIELTISSWISHAIIYSIIILSFNLLLSLFFFKKELIFLKKYLNIKS